MSCDCFGHMCMYMASSCCTWPPAGVWRTVFRQHYSSSSFSKWHQLYIDISCVLLGLKAALLVDYVSPDAKKLQLFLTDVAKLSKESSVKSHPAESQFCRCVSVCCILTVKADTLLVNMKRVAQADRGSIDYDSKLLGHTLSCAQSIALSTDTMSCVAPLRDGPVYIDVTKGLPQPKLFEDENKATVKSTFNQWLGNIQSSFQAIADHKTELCIIPCHPSVSSNCSTLLSTEDEDNAPNFSAACGDVELNVCSVFGLLLGYPVVYWFDTERGYYLDMVELVCFAIRICSKSNSTQTSLLKIDEVTSYNKSI